MIGRMPAPPLCVLGFSMIALGALLYVAEFIHAAVALVLIASGGMLIVRALRALWPH
jgi:hypothetical protein